MINIASVVGFKGYIHQSAYASSKHALTGFTKVFAKIVRFLITKKGQGTIDQFYIRRYTGLAFD